MSPRVIGADEAREMLATARAIGRAPHGCLEDLAHTVIAQAEEKASLDAEVARLRATLEGLKRESARLAVNRLMCCPECCGRGALVENGPPCDHCEWVKVIAAEITAAADGLPEHRAANEGSR